MAATLDVTLATDWVAAGEVASLAVLQSAIENASFGGIGRSHMATDASVLTLSSAALAAPKLGEARVDTGSTPPTLRVYDGSDEAAPQGDFSATQPTTTTSGYRWYHPGLKAWCVYETIDGLAGWHPEDSGVQLMTARSMTDVAPGAPVVRDVTAVSLRECTTSTTLKDQSVLGVLIGKAGDVDFSDNVNTGDDVYVAMVTSGKTVQVYANGGSRSIAKGDGLVVNDTAGEARGVGPLPGNVYANFDERQFGTPLGCFAEALEALASDAKVTARLLGHVGTGCTVLVESTSTKTVTTADTWIDDEFAIGAVALDADHLPAACAILAVELSGDQSAGDLVIEARLSCDRSDPTRTIEFANRGTTATGNEMFRSSEFTMPLVNDTETPTAIGDKYAIYIEQATGSNPQCISYLHGYVY